MDYEKSYYKLKNYCLNELSSVYCDNCKHYDNCDDENCYRKNMGWGFDPKVIKEIERKYS